eukprot:COSAG01_NODE_19222_length_1023_cov_5.112299_1_plen_92_part_00
MLSRRGRGWPANASALDTHRDSITNRFDSMMAMPGQVAARLLPGEGRGHLHPDGGSDIQDLHNMVASTAEPLDADRFVLWVRAFCELETRI